MRTIAARDASIERKTIYFVSLGCAKNRVDSEVMIGVAKREGYMFSTHPEDAQVIVVNTCGFINEAKQESIDTILELAELKRSGSCRKLIVAGCLSQRYPEELATGIHEVDHFLGSSDMLLLGKILSEVGVERMLVGRPSDWLMRSSDPRVLTQSQISAYIKLSEGCNRRCAFCTIPQFRGKQRSRPMEDIVEEVEKLVSQGVKEFNLISQDTLSYGRDLEWGGMKPKEALSTLLMRLADIKNLTWLRVFYLYPEMMNPDLISLIAHHPKIVKYIDMPLQHASDTMLKRMRRGHGVSRQKKLVESLRMAIPKLSFRSAFIVGHPGETEKEFQELVDFVKWAQFEHMGVFSYSDEENSPSADQDQKVPMNIIRKRHRLLMNFQRTISRKKNKKLLGQELEVLVDGVSEEHEWVMKGRHQGQAPEVDGCVFLSGAEVHPGQIRRVKIDQTSDYDLVGEVVDDPSFAFEKHVPSDGMMKKSKVSLKVLAT